MIEEDFVSSKSRYTDYEPSETSINAPGRGLAGHGRAPASSNSRERLATPGSENEQGPLQGIELERAAMNAIKKGKIGSGLRKFDACTFSLFSCI